MSDERPDPLVGEEVELRGFAGFMLDVDRLLSSELVALSTKESIGCALLLWARAWKQSPPASLPNDDRVLANFAGVTPARWKKLKAMALRGFVLCSDNRLYHRVLAEEARNAWQKRSEYRRRRDAANERMQRHRARQRDGGGDGNCDGGRDATSDNPVTRHQTPTGTGTGTGTEKSTSTSTPPAAGAAPAAPGNAPTAWDIARPHLGASLIGRLIREHGEERVEDVILESIRKRPADFKAFVVGGLRNGTGRGSSSTGRGRALSAVERVERANRTGAYADDGAGGEPDSGRVIDGEVAD